jgi:hypothetical protein
MKTLSVRLILVVSYALCISGLHGAQAIAAQKGTANNVPISKEEKEAARAFKEDLKWQIRLQELSKLEKRAVELRKQVETLNQTLVTLKTSVAIRKQQVHGHHHDYERMWFDGKPPAQPGVVKKYNQNLIPLGALRDHVEAFRDDDKEAWWSDVGVAVRQGNVGAMIERETGPPIWN